MSLKDEMIKAFEKKSSETKDPTLKTFMDKRIKILRGNEIVNK